MTIHRLKVTNYKRIDSLGLKGLTPFSVFSGPNGSVKSNFFDALDFVGLSLGSGTGMALQVHGGFANIHSEKRYKENARKFGFEIECDLPEAGQAGKEKLTRFHYSLPIQGSRSKNPQH